MTTATSTAIAIPAGWVTAPKSGHNCNTIMRLRKAGRLVKGRDSVYAQITLPGSNLSRWAWFYDPAALGREIRRERDERGTQSDRMKRHWSARQRLDDDGETLVSHKAALKFLNVSQTMLWLWSDPEGEGCPDIGGKVLRTKTGVDPARPDLRFWYLAELKLVKEARDKRPTEAPDGVYTFEEVAEILPHIPRKVLNDREQRYKRFGLVGVDQPVAANATDQTRYITGFTRASVEECERRFPPPTIPRGMMTVTEAVDQLKISRQSVTQWIKKGWLAAKWADEIPTDAGVCAGWLVERKSVRDARKLIDCDGYHKAGEKLRKRGHPAVVEPTLVRAADQGPTADGPFDPYRFRYGKLVIDLSSAHLRFHLLRVLWNSSTGGPFQAREIDDVLVELYGDASEDTTTDDVFADLRYQTNAFADLRYQTNKQLKEAGLQVRARGGKVWLQKNTLQDPI